MKNKIEEYKTKNSNKKRLQNTCNFRKIVYNISQRGKEEKMKVKIILTAIIVLLTITNVFLFKNYYYSKFQNNINVVQKQ